MTATDATSGHDSLLAPSAGCGCGADGGECGCGSHAKAATPVRELSEHARLSFQSKLDGTFAGCETPAP